MGINLDFNVQSRLNWQSGLEENTKLETHFQKEDEVLTDAEDFYDLDILIQDRPDPIGLCSVSNSCASCSCTCSCATCGGSCPYC